MRVCVSSSGSGCNVKVIWFRSLKTWVVRRSPVESTTRRMKMRRRGVQGEIGMLTAAAAMILFAPLQATPVPAVNSAGAPASPTSVALTSGSKSLGVAWAESSSGALVFTATATSADRPTGTCLTAGHRCTIVALEAGVIYDVSVVARSLLSGSSGPSAVASADVDVPGPPHSVRTVAGEAQATVYWSAPKSTGVSKVTGYVATVSPGGFSCSTARTILSQPARTCEIAGLASATRYSVTVTATNAYGSGSPSKSATVTTT
jgi:trimeric autotransporter adhesin